MFSAEMALSQHPFDTAAQIGNLTIERPWYGEIMAANDIRTTSFHDYLEKRAVQSLKTAGHEFKAVDPIQLAAALPEPDKPAFVHLDAFPGNMLADGETITAVLDFGVSTIIGDRRFDPLTAVFYLAPSITPTANDRDRSVAQEWLTVYDLISHFAAVQNWIAAYWSFATDDISLHRWCRTILVDR